MTPRDRSVPDQTALLEVTKIATRRQQAVHFAGFLVKEDDTYIYIADTLGTWVIPRESVAFMEDWGGAAECAPEYMTSAGGRPVRVGVMHDAIVNEIRPWKMQVDLNEVFHRNLRAAAESIFTLGGERLPVGERTHIGEKQLEQLETTFARQLGWNPDDPCTSPVAGRPGDGTRAAGSHTIVVNDGYCDVDCGF
jgi:hypothetical protein